MPHADFVHLRVHSAYSLSEGAIKVDHIAKLAKQEQMPAVAIADTHNMFGALEFGKACIGAGVQPIIGCQLSLRRQDDPMQPPEPIVALAQNKTGIANLQRLSSFSYIPDSDSGFDEPGIAPSALCEHSEGLFLLTGGTRGPLARMLGDGRRDEAERLLASWREAFGDRLAIELHRHGLEIEAAIEPGLIALADGAGLPLVATNEAFFHNQSMHEAHDALLCIAQGRTMAEANRRRVTDEHWFKPAAAMRKLFADLPEACDNTLAIARKCAAMAETRKPLLPVCPKVREGTTEAETLRAMSAEGLAKRLEKTGIDTEARAVYESRLAYELDVIERMGFPGYFLIVADFIQWAKAHDIPVGPGRGSGAGSLVAWALTITNLDPLPFNLLFERFLNPERVSMPDFDIDFCQDRRDEVISYVRHEYGGERVGQIITFGKLQARAAVRDVGRVLGMPFGQVNRVAEVIPNNPAKPVTLQEAIDGEPKLRQMREEDESIRRLLEIALQLEGLYRHASTHAAGVVIGDRPLIDLVPLYRDPKSGDLVTQYNMKWVEQAGLVKFDFLGLTTLTILQRAVQFLEGAGIHVDLDTLPLDDAPTYQMLARGDASGVFQFESPGMRDVLRQMRPDRLEDLIAAVALYRPGPMANIPDYCARKHGDAWESPHPCIKEILGETYGIMVYQEQVMQIAQVMAGYSLGAADLLRRAMGKKIRAEMEQQRQIFNEGAIANKVPPTVANDVFDLMAKFADYGFNKSHAAAYALVAYQTAWMKANHPVAFLAGCMDLALTNTDKLAVLRQEANRMNITVLPPDINKSASRFTMVRDDEGNYAIRYALAAVKRVGEAAMEGMIEDRGDRPFRDLADFAARVDSKHLNKLQLENLIRAGAFDSIDTNRGKLFAAVETVIRRAQAQGAEKKSGQIGLFGGSQDVETLRVPDIPDWPDLERIGYEADALGFHLTAHPLDAYEPILNKLRVVSSSKLQAAALAGSARAKMAGTVVNVKERTTRTGSRMAWVRLSDGDGSYEVTFFSEALAKCREDLQAGANLLVTVDLKLEGEALRVTAQDAIQLDKAASAAGSGLSIWIDQPSALPVLKALLEKEPTGRGQVTLFPCIGAGQELEITIPGRFALTPPTAQSIRRLVGVARVEAH